MKFTESQLRNVIVHYVGNGNNAEPLTLSAAPLELPAETRAVLADSFLSRFADNHEYFSFAHPSSLRYNEVYDHCRKIFEDATDFAGLTQAVARKLYAASVHPKVKGGELYVCLFDALPVEGRVYKGLGIFKAENKSLFLEASQRGSGIDVALHEGMELTKMDKGCLVINHRPADGFDVLVFDNQSRGEEAQYWREGFLGLAPQKNEYHNTQHLLKLTKQFITGPLESEMGIEGGEQAELLHKSIDYFRSKETFDITEFQSEVFEQDDRIEAFRQFGGRYVESNDFDLAAQFPISPEAVKKGGRIFKSVLKLDKNFHVYIHGHTDLIERGTDADGRKFYKIYYEEER